MLDRDREWRTLDDLWQKPKPQLVFVVGRRRAGKSFLLTRFAQQVGGIYFQATRRTEAEQLASLTRVIGEHFGDAALQHGITFPSWEDLFGYVTRRADANPFLLVLDEFPYLAAAAPTLTSVIQNLWDHTWRKTRIKLVLSGSFITVMNRLGDVDQPLFGRRTAKLVVNAGSLGLAEPEQLWEEVVAPGLDDYMGPVFEQICRDFVGRTDRLPFKPLSVGEWWDASSTNQVDVVAVGTKGLLLVGECKWGRVTAAHLAELTRRAALVSAEWRSATRPYLALFSGRGEADDEVRREAAAGNVLLFSPEDLRTPIVGNSSESS